MAATNNDILEPNIIDLFDNFARYKLLILCFIAFGVAIGWILIQALPQKYEAQALIMIQNAEQELTSDGKSVTSTLLPAPSEAIILSQIEVLKSRDLAKLVVQDLNLIKSKEFLNLKNSKLRNDDEILGYMSKNLTVKPVGRSLVIDLRFKHINANIAEQVANRYIELYQEQQIKDKIKAAAFKNQWLQEKVADLAKKLRNAAKNVEDYRAKEDLIDGAKAEITSQQISEINSQLISAQAELASTEAKKTQIKNLLDNKKSIDGFDDIVQSNMVTLLKKDENILAAQYADLLTKYGPQHPRILAIQAELAEVKVKKEVEMTHVSDNVSNEVLGAKAKVVTLEKNLNDVEEKRKRENKAAIGLRELEREAEANRILYENFLNRSKESDFSRETQQSDSKIISRARIPNTLSGVNPLAIIILFGCCGLLLGLMVAVLLEQIDRKILAPIDLSNVIDEPILASIPKTDLNRRDFKIKTKNPEKINLFLDSIRLLRFRLNNLFENDGPKVITITSVHNNEGASSVAFWLAKLYAIESLNVLYIDSNFEKPNFCDRTNHLLPLRSIINNENDYSKYIEKDDKNHLSILTGQRSKINDIEKISEKNISGFLNSFKKDFDIIIVDIANFHENLEVKYFAVCSDHCLLVTSWNQTPLKIIYETYKSMLQDKIKLSGTVISNIPLSIYQH